MKNKSYLKEKTFSFLFLALFLGGIFFFSGEKAWADDWSVGGGLNSSGGWSINIGAGSGSSGGFWSTGLPSGSIYSIIMGILGWLLAIIGAVGIIGFILSGILYLTAAGDDTQIGRAKKAMTNSIIGVIVALSGFVVIQAVHAMLNGFSF